MKKPFALTLIAAALLASTAARAADGVDAATAQKLEQQIKTKGYTIVPVRVYFKKSLAKVEIALARGKKLYDKRADLARRDQERQAQKEFKIRNLR